MEVSSSKGEILKRSNVRVKDSRLCFYFYLFSFSFSVIFFFKLRVRVIV